MSTVSSPEMLFIYIFMPSFKMMSAVRNHEELNTNNVFFAVFVNLVVFVIVVLLLYAITKWTQLETLPYNIGI